MAHSMLIISRQAPWSGLAAREALDIALAGGAFELPLALLLLDDGVFQLNPEQRAEALEQKDLSANLKALPLFGIETIHVARDSLVQRGLDIDSLGHPIELIEESRLGDFIARFDHVVTL